MVKIFADGADIHEMRSIAPIVQGFTTNPTLMRKAQVDDYKAFACRAIAAFPDHPLSLEVFADDFATMEEQARKIAAWGPRVYVKIPACNTAGASSAALISRLAGDGIKVNVTAVLCFAQIDAALDALRMAPAIVSIFAGRIADTGRKPEPFIAHALERRRSKQHEILWASTRQVLDVYTADALGCDIITCSNDIINKLSLEGKNLMEYSRETVKMFHDDAKAAGFYI
jgi:transaldolase